MPRMGERYPIPGLKATWKVPSRRKVAVGRLSSTDIRLVDISVAGALVESVPNRNVDVGSRLTWELNGCKGVVEVRNVREEDGRAFYGVSYFSMDDDLRALVNRVVEKVRKDHNLSTQWERRVF